MGIWGKWKNSRIVVLHFVAKKRNILLFIAPAKNRIEKPQVDKIDRPVSTPWIYTQIKDTDLFE